MGAGGSAQSSGQSEASRTPAVTPVVTPRSSAPQKSDDEMFEALWSHFSQGRDTLKFAEMRELAATTDPDADFNEEVYKHICESLSTTVDLGVNKAQLRLSYTTSGAQHITDDYTSMMKQVGSTANHTDERHEEMFDEMWKHFSHGKDRLMFDDMRELAAATDPEAEFNATVFKHICESVGTTPEQGINRQQLRKSYETAGSEHVATDHASMIKHKKSQNRSRELAISSPCQAPRDHYNDVPAFSQSSPRRATLKPQAIVDLLQSVSCGPEDGDYTRAQPFPVFPRPLVQSTCQVDHRAHPNGDVGLLELRDLSTGFHRRVSEICATRMRLKEDLKRANACFTRPSLDIAQGCH